MQQQTVLDVRNLSVRFAGLRACSNISFSVQKSETLAIIGPNGAGKTTLINALTSAVVTEPGSSVLLSTPQGPKQIGNLRADLIVQLGVTRTFQNILLVPQLNVRESVLLGRYVHQRSGIVSNMFGSAAARRENKDQLQRVDAILAKFELLDCAEKLVAELPYGLRKRVELARALAQEPRVLLLDEPVAGMSTGERVQMAGYVRLAKSVASDISIVLIEHDMRFVMSLADRVIAMNEGAIIAVGTPGEIQLNPKVLEAYLGPNE